MDIIKLRKRAEDLLPEMIDTRRHLHRYPEVSYKEFKTTDFIIDRLEGLGIHVDRPLETGCVGVIEGGVPSDKVVALRADIDALSMEEEGSHKGGFISQNEGVAHCCGHDGHTANLLGAAQILAENRDALEGTVLLVFQPGEEKLPGGGRLLCETGYLQDKGVDVIYGLHTSPKLAPGQIGIRKGPLMARPDEFEITITGKGGHAASPHETVDPIVLAAQVINQLQTIVSRNVNPTEPAVVTVGKIWGGSAHNIIPEKVRMLGTVRTFSQDTAHAIRDRIGGIVQGITAGAGASYGYVFNEGYPAVSNTPWAIDLLADTAAQVIGRENILELEDPIMAGEDFAFYQQEFPGAFFFLGSGSKTAESQWSWHHPRYNIDEACLMTGAALMAALPFRDLPGEA